MTIKHFTKQNFLTSPIIVTSNCETLFRFKVNDYSKLKEDTHKKSFFSGRTTKLLPTLHQWLSGPYHFFFPFF